MEIFTVKYNNVEKLTKAKCRLVAREDLEPRYMNYFSPVVFMVAFRVFLVLSVHFDGDLRQLDGSKLDRPVYFDLPTGHVAKEGRTKVW